MGGGVPQASIIINFNLTAISSPSLRGITTFGFQKTNIKGFGRKDTTLEASI